MKKNAIIATITGFICLILGLILAGIGFFSGGLTQLEAKNQPKEVTLTFQDIHSIVIDGYGSDSFFLSESPDDQVHVTYYQLKNDFRQPTQVSEKEGILTLTSGQRDLHIEGLIRATGELLARRNLDTHTIHIAYPKGKKLDKLSAGGFYSTQLTIEKLSIKEVDLSASLTTNQVTIEKGKITAPSDHVSLTDSQLKETSIIGAAGIYLYNSSLHLSQVKGYQWFHAEKLTVTGDSQLTSSLPNSYTEISLSDKSLKELTLALTTKTNLQQLGMTDRELTEAEMRELLEEDPYLKDELDSHTIRLAPPFTDLTVKKEFPQESLTRSGSSSTDKLTIKVENGGIQLGRLAEDE